nr:MAG TPA_asm: hypothetical protein [Caudoviricetes sp.]
MALIFWLNNPNEKVTIGTFESLFVFAPKYAFRFS